MVYQARYAHLESIPDLKKGQKIRRNMKIGRMGDSGKSYAPHLHFDLIQDIVSKNVYRLSEIPGLIYNLPALMAQYHYFIDLEMFKYKPVITSSFGDPDYLNHGVYEFHPAFDIVPEDRHTSSDHFDIFWNRTPVGEVTAIGQDAGYGNFVCIYFEV